MEREETSGSHLDSTDADSSFEVQSKSFTEEDDCNTGKVKVRSVYIDKLNKAARTILDHNDAHQLWTSCDYHQDSAILSKINGPQHYTIIGARHAFLKKFQ